VLVAGVMVTGVLLSGEFISTGNACKRVLNAHVIDPMRVGLDALPPNPPTLVVAKVERRLGMQCTQNGCLSSSCGDTGTVDLTFTPASDDQTAGDATNSCRILRHFPRP
jgi:hypothetical protein